MEEIRKVIKSQYLAALAMLRQAVETCPDALWDAPGQKNRFWHTAYHVLFYTHLYLHRSEDDYAPWAGVRRELRSLRVEGDRPADPYSRNDILDYLAFCEEQVGPLVDALDLNAVSGFDWLPFGKLELQFYNIRHIQQHTGELYQQLLEENIEVGWVGMVNPI
jgi:hypothetical protein